MKFNRNNLLVILIVGLLLVVMAIPTGGTKAEISYNTETEKRLESILSEMEGVGEVRVMVTFQEDDVVEGVAVIADGGENPVVVQNIIEVVQALFHVESHKIKVIKSNS